MAELADAQDLGSCIERCVGSSPTSRIDIKTAFTDGFLLKAVFIPAGNGHAALNGTRNGTKSLKSNFSMPMLYNIPRDKTKRNF